NGEVGSLLSPAAPGVYEVTVSEQQTGCILILEGSIGVSTPPVLNVITLLPGDATSAGSISVVPPYPAGLTFAWSTGQEGPVLDGLTPGTTYTLTTTDESECDFSFEYYVPDCDNDRFVIDFLSTVIKPLDHPDGGGVDLVVSSSHDDLSFSWTQLYGNFTSDQQNLSGITSHGYYFVTVTDNLCHRTIETSFQILQSCGVTVAFSEEQGQCSDDPLERAFTLDHVFSRDVSPYLPEWGIIEWDIPGRELFRQIESMSYYYGTAVAPTHPSSATQSGFDSGIASLTFIDEFGCRSLPSSRLYSPENSFHMITSNTTLSETVSSQLEGVFSRVAYEFSGVVSCGWVFENERQKPSPVVAYENDFRRAQFYANGFSVGDNVCQRGGTIRIDGSVVDHGTIFNNPPDIPFFEYITIPPNNEAIYVNDQEEFEGCIFPPSLFEYPNSFVDQQYLTQNFIPIFTPLAGTDGDNSDFDIEITFTITNEDIICNDRRIEDLESSSPSECPVQLVICDEPGNSDYNQVIGEITGGTSECKCAANLELYDLDYTDPHIELLWVTYCDLDNYHILSSQIIGFTTAEYDHVVQLPWCGANVEYGLLNPGFPGVTPVNCYQPFGGIVAGGDQAMVASRHGQREQYQMERVNPKLLNNPYPNPSSGVINIEISSPKETTLQVRVMDVNGGVAYKNDKWIDKGASNLQLSLPSSLSSGVYYISIYNESGLLAIKRFILM
ncbi:MAG: T9SS type A sorting domain-containing protein, partial [Saprospiraceae bacterium]